MGTGETSGLAYRRLRSDRCGARCPQPLIWEKDENIFLRARGREQRRFERFLLVRTEADPGNAMNAVQAVAQEIDPLLRVSARRIDEALPLQMAPFRAVARLSGVLGLLALLLGCDWACYGVMAFVVTQRTQRDRNPRRSGARPQQVIKRVLSSGIETDGRRSGVGAGRRSGNIAPARSPADRHQRTRSSWRFWA
mgnify:CR=1 FL=1